MPVIRSVALGARVDGTFCVMHLLNASPVAILVVLLAGGLLAGTLGGLLGIGGGFVLRPLLHLVVGLPPAHAAGTCILAVLFTTLGGSYRHYRRRNIHLPSLAPLVVSGGLASGLSSLLFQVAVLRARWLDLAVGLVFLLVSARLVAEAITGFMERRRVTASDNVICGTPAQKLSTGAVAGVLPGLLGVGRGGILVSAFTLLLRVPVKVAVAASLACFCCNAFVSSAFRIAQGHVALGMALPAWVGTFVGANLGTTLDRRLRSRTPAFLLGLLFIYASARLILVFFETPA